MFDIEANLREFSMSSPPGAGCRDEDLLRLIDLCPFLASEKAQYDDGAVLDILRRNPSVARLRHSFRCGIGNVVDKARPLALVAALGGSLEVVRLLAEACPEALEEKLSGRRNVLHYAIAEGVDVEIVRYLTSRNPALAREVDSFEAVPLHLAATYPSSSPSVLRHLLRVHPEGAGAVDYRYLTPLHRACKSRASLEKVMPLIEARPLALFARDGGRITPLGWSERVERSLTDALPEVVEILEMTEDVLRLGADDDSSRMEGVTHVAGGDERRRARQILARFRSIQWWGGMRLAFAYNMKLWPLMDVPIGILPELMAAFCRVDNYITPGSCFCGDVDLEESKEVLLKFGLECVFSILVQCPDVVGSTAVS